MKRNYSGWGIIFLALALMSAGAYGLYAGWDLIQLERGWSQFIAGSVALSGGVITLALGRLIQKLGNVTIAAIETAPALSPQVSVATSSRTAPQMPVAPLAQETPSTPAPPQQQFPNHPPPSAAQTETSEVQKEEVDRYSSGETTYIMFSDGSVEVRRPNDVQHYESLAALRAAAAMRR